MKIGLIGDVHGEDVHLAWTIEALATLKPDVVLCVGDIADGPGSVDACVQLLQDHNVHCVMGNHDRWLLEGTLRSIADATLSENIADASLSYLSALPQTLEIPTPHGVLLLCHGLGSNDMRKLNEDDFDYPYTLECNPEFQDILGRREHAFVVSGHTHRRMARDFQGISFINAGTLKKHQDPGYAVLDTETRKVLWFSLSQEPHGAP